MLSSDFRRRSFPVRREPSQALTPSVWRRLGLIAALALVAVPAVATSGEGSMWSIAGVDADGWRSVTLDQAAVADFEARLSAAWSTPGGAVVALPVDDGVIAFRLQRAEVMPDALAARFPRIRAFRGTAPDHRGWTIRAEHTPSGFRAQIDRPDRADLFLEPVADGPAKVAATGRFRLAPRHAFRPPSEPFHCGVSGQVRPVAGQRPDGSFDAISVGPTLRTYRLAVAATGEYTRFHGGTVEAGLAAIVTAVNRLNGIFRRDLALRFALSPRNDELVFANPATDPFTPDDLNTMLDENQALLDQTLGAGGYDLGHVFHNAGGGLAALASVCGAFKANGGSGIGRPIGDPFVAEYVAHEIGHQLGAPHSFNGTTGACGANRSPISAFEPGSGSTIMSYAGICGAEDLQAGSDAYFHVRSLDFMAAVVHGPSGACGNAASGNAAPRMNAGPDRAIPARTPFTLTGSAVDAQSVSVTWEEVDLGSPSPPASDDGSRPLFRSWPPTGDRTRTLPRLNELLNGGEPFGETLPTTSRELRFRMTGRDGAGGVASDEVMLQVVGSAGPFRVTQPDRGTIWRAGEEVEVRWDPAGTERAPIRCSSVDLDVSWDGGRTWPDRIASAVPNNGAATVRVPDRTAESVRLRAACSDNLFFALSDDTFAIRGETTCTPSSETLCLNGGRFKLSLSWRDTSGETGVGQWVAGTPSDDSGLLYFFESDNWELLVKVLNGCAFNQRFWVFGAATTDLGFTLRVVDTSTGEVRTYRNTAGQAAQAIIDTNAFATCP